MLLVDKYCSGLRDNRHIANACKLMRKEHKAELFIAHLISCLLVAVIKQFSSADGAASLMSGYHSNIALLSCLTVESMLQRR